MKVLHNIKISSTFAASIKEMVTFDGEIAQLVRAHDTKSFSVLFSNQKREKSPGFLFLSKRSREPGLL